MALDQGRAIGGRRLWSRRAFGVFGFPFAAMLPAFKYRGHEMQREKNRVVRWLGIATVVLGTSGSGTVLAQSAAEPVPDYAALIGVRMTAAEVVQSRSAGSAAHDVQRRIDRTGARRTAAERAASEGLNRALAAMPETVEQALRQAAADKSGAGIVRTSRQEIEPMYAVPSRGGGTNASHGGKDQPVR